MHSSLFSVLLGLILVGASSLAFAQNESRAREVDPPTTRSETEEEEEEELEEWEIDFERRKAAFRPKRNHSSRGRCRFDWSLQPEQLMPGQTGVLKIMMIMESNAVMRSAADLTASQRAPAGNLALGDMTLGPPRISKLAKAYQGKPIYDDWALLEMPITMAADAPPGSQQAALVEADFELHDGVSGTSMGRYRKVIRVTCTVGAEVQESATGPSGPSGGPEDAARSVSGDPTALAGGESQPATGQAVQVDEEASGSSPQPDGGFATEGSGTSLLVGAVLIVGVGLLLLLFRRR